MIFWPSAENVKILHDLYILISNENLAKGFKDLLQYNK